MLEPHLFGTLPAVELRRLASVARRRSFRRSEVVFHRGDPADTLHLIKKGRFAARVTTRLGQTATISVHGPGEAFGELALVDADARRSTTVAALEAAETYAVHQDDFHRLRRQYPSVNDVLVQLLARRTRRVSERLVEALFVPAETRVLRRVCELARFYGETRAGHVIPLSQEDIAGLAGTSRATVNRVLGAERERGTVDVNRGRTLVLDLQAIERHSRAEA